MDENEKQSELDKKPTDDEILESVKKENKKGDEYEINALRKAHSIGFAVAMILSAIIVLVTVILGNEPPYVLWFVIFGAEGATFTFYGSKVERRRKLFLGVGIFLSVTSLIMLVAWILQLCGII